MINEPEYIAIRLPSKMYNIIEEKVVSLYKELNITKVPIDPFNIAKQKGFIVKPFSQFNKDLYGILLRDKKDKIDGISHYDPDLKTFVIYYDENQVIQRIRFTIMHEIAHIEMGHKQESELARKIADYYAAYSLAPSPLIWHFKCEDFIDVSTQFDISTQCADYCFSRYTNRANFGGKTKKYEMSLLGLFR